MIVMLFLERIKMEPTKFFEILIDFIEKNVTEKIIVEDLGSLVAKEKFKILRKVLKREIVSMLKK